jgi:serine protease Do
MKISNLGLLISGALAIAIASSSSACHRQPREAADDDDAGVLVPASRQMTKMEREALPLPSAVAPDRRIANASIPDVVERVMPSVVSVTSTRTIRRDQLPGIPFGGPFLSPFGGGEPPSLQLQGLGSGVIVARDVVLTNAHVVQGTDSITVRLGDKRELEAHLAGADPKSDLAVLKLKGDTSGLKPIAFADSSRLRLGDFVLAIGNPFGVGQTVTMGIASGKGRANIGIIDYEDFIQTDAAVNPGNSGGALVDLEGKLVGIPTAILSPTGGSLGIGFAIPSNMAKPIMQALLEHGKVSRGWLGVNIQDVDEKLAKALDLPSTSGVLVSDVADGPGARAGLRRGDVILSVEGTNVESSGELRNLVAAAGVGKKVKLEVVRQGRKQNVEVTLGEMPTEPAATPDRAPSPPKGAAGIVVSELTPELRQRLSVPGSV